MTATFFESILRYLAGSRATLRRPRFALDRYSGNDRETVALSLTRRQVSRRLAERKRQREESQR